MSQTYRIFDNTTAEELFPSDGFQFPDAPAINQTIADPEINRHFGGTATIRRIEEQTEHVPSDSRTRLYIEALQRDKPVAYQETKGRRAEDADMGGGGIEGVSSGAGRDGGMLTEP